MPDRLRTRTRPRSEPLVASATLVDKVQLTDPTLFQPERWQDEAWGFHDSLGEFNFGVTWLSQALSRVRLMAAEQVPGGDEPEPLTDGPAVELVEQLGGGIGGRAALMESLGVQVSVPGEGWIVGQRASTKTPLDMAEWSVKSTDEIRASRGRNATVEVRTDDRTWTPLEGDALVCRIFRPHKRWSWKADSSARSAIPIMREIDLYNRRIIATMVSRLAMNGLLLIPQEGTITVPEQYADSADPFVQMLIDIAGRNIKNPGGASASIPIPVRFQGELIDQWKHLTFGDGVDEPLLDAREKAIGRLATTLNMPAEVLKGMGDTSHWNAWQIGEEGIKLHISPFAETIVGGLTTGFLHPMLGAEKTAKKKGESPDPVGPNGGKIVVWYDTSELSARPDKSAQAQQAYDRIEISGAAFRRELGLDEGDAPEDDEKRERYLRQLLANAQLAAQVLADLTGKPLEPPDETPVAGAPQPSGPGGDDEGAPAPTDTPAEAPATGPPTTRDNPPPPPGDGPPQRSAATLAPFVFDVGNEPVAAVTAGRTNGHSRDGPKRRRR